MKTIGRLVIALAMIVIGTPVFSQTKPDVREMEKIIKSKKGAPAKKIANVKSGPSPATYNIAEHEESVKTFFTMLIDKALTEKPEQLQTYIDPQLDTNQTTIVSILAGFSALKKTPTDSLHVNWNASSRISAPVLYKNKHYTQIQLLLDVTIQGEQHDSTLTAVKEYVSSMSYRLNKMIFQTLNPGYHFLPTGTLLENFDLATGEGHLILFEEVWLSRNVAFETWQVTRKDGPLDKNYMSTNLIPKSIQDKADASLRRKIPKKPASDFPTAGLVENDTIVLSKTLDSYFQAISKADTTALKHCLAPSLSLSSEPGNIIEAYSKYRTIASVQVDPVVYQRANEGLQLNGKRYLMMLVLTNTTLKAKGEEGREVLKMTHPSMQTTLDIIGDVIREKFQLDAKKPLIEFDEATGKLMYYALVPTYLVASSDTNDWKVVFETADLPVGVVGY